jgi:hypothetical protein
LFLSALLEEFSFSFLFLACLPSFGGGKKQMMAFSLFFSFLILLLLYATISGETRESLRVGDELTCRLIPFSSSSLSSLLLLHVYFSFSLSFLLVSQTKFIPSFFFFFPLLTQLEMEEKIEIKITIKIDSSILFNFHSIACILYAQSRL